jgi:hypothetical protein
VIAIADLLVKLCDLVGVSDQRRVCRIATFDD